MTKRRPCPAAAAQQPSHATMLCTWTGYGASPPAAYKYRGEHRKQEEEDDFVEKGRNEGGQNFGEGEKGSDREGSKTRERRVLKKEQRRDLRRNKERRTLLTKETHRGKEELQQLASTPHRRPHSNSTGQQPPAASHHLPSLLQHP